jgi:alkanesulfonate monooxygenase SsuD/methylene tetrahydromethanopterin reductase-like flavin-dependent oxidoreductase (luciferase family)
MKFFILSLPFPWEHLNKPVRMAGKRTDLYQRSMEALVEHAKIADRCGFEGMFFSEQRGNVEGIPEVTANPILLDLFIAQHTERLKVGQLGNVLPAHNPLHVADQIAQLDQLTKGRVLCGFARGNTSRWVDAYGQQLDIKATRSDKGEADERNMRAFKESWEIIKTAWTQDTFSFDGEFWKFPVPGTKWTYPPSKDWGEAVDDDDNLLGVGIAPGCYQKPYPRIFGPMGGRTATVRFWAGEGATIVSLAPSDDFNQGMLNVYAEGAREAGREVRRGEGVIIGGSYAIGDTEARAKARADEFREWDTRYYGVPPYNLPHPLGFNGTPAQIVDQIGGLNERLGIEEFIIMDNFGAPHGYEAAQEMLELFGTEVIPQLRGSDTEPAAAAAAVSGS